MKIKHSHQKKIINYICDNFHESETTLSDYLCKNSSTIVQQLELPYEDDIFYYTIGDINSNDYKNFVELFKKELNNLSTSSKIILKEDLDDYNLTNSIYGKNINLDIKNNLFENLNSLKNLPQAPLLYESFCGEFFKDMGFQEVEVTRSSNDFGIDIVAILPLPSLNHLLPEKLTIIAQVKYYETQLDTSFIRKLIGDSLFIKFDSFTYTNVSHDPLCLYLIGHNGFTKEAKLFAVKNGVKLLDSQDICDFLSSLENPYDAYATKFLVKTYEKVLSNKDAF